MDIDKRIWIGNDHGGYLLKQAVMEHLEARGIPFENIGSDTTEVVRYPLYAKKIAHAISERRIERGILICSTGIGMSIIANRYPGVRASLCTSTYMGRLTRAHNDSNLLCLGGRITGDLEALDILDAWLDTAFEGGRHCISLDLIKDAENELIGSFK